MLAVIRGSAVGTSTPQTTPSTTQEHLIRRALSQAGLDPNEINAVEAHGTGTPPEDQAELTALHAVYGTNPHPVHLGALQSTTGHTGAASGAAALVKLVEALRHGTLPPTPHLSPATTPTPTPASTSTSESAPTPTTTPDPTAALRPGASGPSGAETGIRAEPRPGSVTRAGTGTGIGIRVGNGTGTGAGAGTGSGSGTGSEAGTVSVTGTAAEAGTAPGAGPGPGLGPGAGFAFAGVSGSALVPLVEPVPWVEPRRVGVSSLGRFGTDAHLILEQPPVIDVPTAGAGLPLTPWVLSAKSPEALRAHGLRLRAHLDAHPEASAAEVAVSLVTRSGFSHRAVLLGRDREELVEQLDQVVAGRRAGVVLPLSGQGAQHVGMGRDLHDAFPVFARAWDSVCPPEVTEIAFHGPSEELDRVEVAQRALFAFHVALFRLYEHHGVTPDHLVGHSVGEVAAAHLAGALDLADALALLDAHARLAVALLPDGLMASVEATEEELEPLLGDGVCLASVNSPDSAVVSGDPGAVLSLVDHWRARGRQANVLRTGGAFHSHHCDTVAVELAIVATGLQPRPCSLSVVSTLEGKPVDGFATAGYWARQLRQPVRFHDALEWARRRHGAITALPTTRPGADGVADFLTGLARAHEAGRAVRWTDLLPAARRVPLPGYPFQRRCYWPAPDTGAAPGDLGVEPGGHPLLTARVDVPSSGEIVFTGVLSAQAHPWLADHEVGGVPVLPSAAVLDMALHVAAVLDAELAELLLHEPLPLTGRTALRLTANPHNGTLVLHVRESADWLPHATAVLNTQAAGETAEAEAATTSTAITATATPTTPAPDGTTSSTGTALHSAGPHSAAPESATLDYTTADSTTTSDATTSDAPPGDRAPGDTTTGDTTSSSTATADSTNTSTGTGTGSTVVG
ncbi:acyltransferase domain-containing protein, partial [Actinosynnema sp.]|uniref:acyltransferase domain-containing protein n=1 Tax=Actinosynnema sp. TaxID=1872144 RepID=UPI003F87C915